MLSLEAWHKTKSLRIISLGILVHVSLFFGALDVYFSSPVEFGLNSFKTNFSLADRVVVFIADGLRYEALEDINFDGYTPFLNKIRRQYGVWGVSYTRVPTESRPGHVALFGGMYEDPSAVLSGWKHNPVNVDNVFNQSVESLLWGSPDIVPMFNRDNLKKINTHYYDSNFEDFSGRKSTIELDKWVFEHVKDYLNRTSVQRLQGGGKIFFLHLLGMDTVGHVFKPNSQEYIDNLKYVDKEIENMFNLFQGFFKDNKTSYIFTSDHGMTDWGSHGSGSDHETESPFIAWGSGMKRHEKPCYLHQADVTPLISALLGINFPTNSVGLVPYMYLNATTYEEVLLLYTNMRQLGERFNKRHERIQCVTVYGFFKPFPGLNKKIFAKKINQIEVTIEKRSYEVAKEDILELIDLIREGDRYINHYYKYPLLFSLSLGLVFWMIYLILHVIQYSENEDRISALSNKFRIRCLINYVIILIALVIALQYHQIQLKYQFYLFFPCLVLIPLIVELNQIIYLFKYLLEMPKLQLLLKISYCSIGLSSLVFSFYYEFYIIVPVLLLALWSFSLRKYCSGKDILLWIFTPILVCYYPTFSKFTKDFSALQTITSCFIAFYVLFIKIKNLSNQLEYKTNSKLRIYCYILKIYLALLTLAVSTVMVYTIFGITAVSSQLTICTISWFILCTALILAAISPCVSINRALDISILFLIIFIMTSKSGESLFLVVFVILQLQWVFLETHNYEKDQGDKNQANFDDFRRCMFFIYFILLSYFGAGNAANMNTFDPMWARQFVIVFNPFLSATIILLKITIPFLVTTIFFQTINTYTKTPTINVFSIIMLYCDILVIYFMYSIKNEGSWLYIGLSISRFVIVSVMTIVLLLFYGIAKFLTKNTLFNSFYVEKY